MKYILCFIGVFLWLTCIGQNQMLIPMSDVLRSANADPAVIDQQRHLTYIEQTQRHLPFAEELSVRTETDRFQLYREEYLARLSVNGLKEMQRNRQLHTADLRTEQNLERIYWHDALVNRYAVIAAYVHYHRLHRLQEELAVVYADKIQVVKKVAYLGTDADVDELIRTEYDRDELELDIADTESDLQTIEQMVGDWLADTIGSAVIDTTGYISIVKINQILGQIPDSAGLNPNVLEKQSKIDLIGAKYQMEKANASQVLDFFQVRYANRPQAGPFNEEFSVGLGITLPYKGSSRVKTSALKIEEHNANQDLATYLYNLSRQIEEAKMQAANLGKRYTLAQQQWMDSQARFTLEHPIDARIDGPLPLLKARELQIKRQLQLLDIEKDLTEQYLNVLDWTGAISATPLVNYLSSGLEEY